MVKPKSHSRRWNLLTGPVACFHNCVTCLRHRLPKSTEMVKKSWTVTHQSHSHFSWKCHGNFRDHICSCSCWDPQGWSEASRGFKFHLCYIYIIKLEFGLLYLDDLYLILEQICWNILAVTLPLSVVHFRNILALYWITFIHSAPLLHKPPGLLWQHQHHSSSHRPESNQE